jgi:hypothetical protein
VQALNNVKMQRWGLETRGEGGVRGKGGRGEGIQKGRRTSREERPMILNF